jgi:hypothetical protein
MISLAPMQGTSSHKPSMDVRLQPLQKKNISQLSNAYPAMTYPKALSPEPQHFSPPPQWLGTMQFQPYSHKHSVSEPSTVVPNLTERTVSPGAEMLAPLPKRSSRPPSEIDELTVDDREFRTPGHLKPLNSNKNHTNSTGKGPPDLNDLKETPL